MTIDAYLRGETKKTGLSTRLSENSVLIAFMLAC